MDLRLPIDAATVAEIRKAWLEHLVLCFPDQELDMHELSAFAAHFGTLEYEPNSHYTAPEARHVTILTNKTVNGRAWDGYKPGHNWHTDESHSTQPTAASFLLAKEIPPVGGDTMFANQYMAYETLSPAMQTLLEPLWAIHVPFIRYRGQSGDGARKQAASAAGRRSAAQPVVRLHDETFRKALYLGQRVQQFGGMTEEESRPLVDWLNEHCTRYEFTYRHRWSRNDLIMWDNRCLLHIALSDYDLGREIRHMLRVAIAGEPCGHWVEDDAEPAAVV